MADVALVAMPFIDLNRPSLALSTLKPILAREGVDAAVVCEYLRFAEMIGARPYVRINRSRSTQLLGEWIYSRAAFRGASSDGGRVADQILGMPAEDGSQATRRERLREWLEGLASAASDHVEEAAQRIVATRPRIVGCTSTFQQHVPSLALLRRIRELDPEIVTMMGGANCEALMGVTTHRNFEWVDYVVSGDADAIVAPMCRAIFEHGRAVPPGELPEGVFAPVHRVIGYTGQATHPGAAPRAVFYDVESLPYADFTDYFAALGESYIAPAIRPGLVAETSRGCWWGAIKHCTFCGLNGGGMTFRSKSPDRAYEELEWLASRWNLDTVEVVDNILDMRYFDAFLPRLARSSRPWSIFYETKSNLKREQVRSLASAGIRCIQPGIESLHSKVLQLMEKGASAYQQLLLLKWARESAVALVWNVLWNFPGEEDAWYAEMAELVPLLAHLPPPSSTIRIRYDRFSPYFDRADEFRLRLRPFPMMAHIYPLSDEELFDQAYFFVDTADVRTPGPGVTKLMQSIREWKAAYRNGGAVPILTMRDDGESIEICDGRPCAVRPMTTLTGVERAIILAAEEAVGERQLPAVIGEGGLRCDPAELGDTVARLQEAGLLVAIDGRYVSLPLRHDLPAWPYEKRQFPGGEVDLLVADALQKSHQHGNLLEALME